MQITEQNFYSTKMLKENCIPSWEIMSGPDRVLSWRDWAQKHIRKLHAIN